MNVWTYVFFVLGMLLGALVGWKSTDLEEACEALPRKASVQVEGRAGIVDAYDMGSGVRCFFWKEHMKCLQR